MEGIGPVGEVGVGAIGEIGACRLSLPHRPSVAHTNHHVVVFSAVLIFS